MYSKGLPVGVWVIFFVQSIPIAECMMTKTSSG
jgi:hypothetical protein